MNMVILDAFLVGQTNMSFAKPRFAIMIVYLAKEIALVPIHVLAK